MHVVEFIRSKPDKKVLVFFPSCGGVKYFHTILVRVLKNDHFTLFTVTLPRQNAQSRLTSSGKAAMALCCQQT